MIGRLALVIALAAALPPSYEVDENYVAVRKDVLAQMDAADKNLPKCEAGLTKAQEDLQTAQKHIDELQAKARELQQHKALLEAHITALETVLQREPSYGDQFVRGWEEVDGPVGLAVGWSVGTFQCIGLAWVFNQDGFRSR